LFTFFSTSVVLNPEVHQIVHSSIQSGYRIPSLSTKEITMTFEPNHYLFMVPSTHAVTHVPVDNAYSSHELELEVVFDGQLVPEVSALAPGEAIIRIRNRTNQVVPVGLLKDRRMAPTPPEQRTGPLYTITPYFTAKDLISSQTFRDLFRTESIPPAGGIEVRNLTLLFTDLKGSTAMYDKIGDLNALSLVREHFALLRGIIAAYHGAVVKTMGDAVMASFSDPVSALQAAAVMRRETLKAGGGEKLSIKIGVHSGPCIAIDTNDQLDYFGQTVNIASRVQAVAAGGEIVCTEAVYAASGAEEVIQDLGLQPTRDQGLLKGLGNPVIFYRLR